MQSTFRQYIAAIPTPLAGLSLGIAGLGLGLEKALPLHSFGQSIGAGVALCMLLCVVCKFTFSPALLQQDLKHPVLGSILPTVAMSLMLIAKTLGTWHALAGEILWLFAIVLHLLLMVLFIYHRSKNLELQAMLPSWFVPFVGVGMAAVTLPGPEYASLAYGLLVFGMINYAVLLPIMLYRLIFSSEIVDAAKPTIAIMAAPASLSLAGYLNLEPEPSLLLCSLLLGIAVLMTTLVYMAFFKLLRLNFSPAFASFTFPMAVGATALYKVSERLAIYPEFVYYAQQLNYMAVVEVIIATIIVLYVCVRYFIHYAHKISCLHIGIPIGLSAVCHGKNWHPSIR